jgi:hypothetical protein
MLKATIFKSLSAQLIFEKYIAYIVRQVTEAQEI